MKEIIYIGFIMGYIKTESVKNWADSHIATGNFDDFLIDSSTTNDLISVLKIDPISEESIDFYLKAYQKLLLNGYSNWEAIQEEMIKLYHNNFVIDNDSFFFSRLSDDYSLRKDGLSENMDMPNELYDFLKKYQNIKIEFIDLHLIIIDDISLNEIL